MGKKIKIAILIALFALLALKGFSILGDWADKRIREHETATWTHTWDRWEKD